MRIDRLQVESFLGIRSVDLSLESPVTLIAGPNGSGKSSLKDAVIFCALGETARAPKLKKKDFDTLLHPNRKRGSVTLQIDGVMYSRGLPTGNFSTASFDPPKGSELLLDPAAFLRLGLDERRKELFRVLGIGMDSGSILAKLVERGYEEPVLTLIRSFLREGFAIAAHECKGMARQKKGSWQQITGSEWGAVKAKDWFAETFDPELPVGDLSTYRKTVANLEGQLTRIDGDIGVARHAQATAVQRAAQEREAKEQTARAWQETERRQARIMELRETVAGEEEAKAAQQAAQQAVEEAEEKMGPMVDGLLFVYTCEACGDTSLLAIEPDGAYSKVPGRDKPSFLAAMAAGKARVNDARSTLTLRDTRLRGIETARHVLDELLAAQGQPVDPVPTEPESAPVLEGQPIRALVNLEANRQNLATRLQEAREVVRRVEDHQERIAQAKQRTADAAALHAEIETWLRLAEDLGPEGIPAQLLHQAIDPINDRLAYSGNSLGFMGLSLTPDMELVGRPEENDPEIPRHYELLSESARWRCEAALADAIGVEVEKAESRRQNLDLTLGLPLVLDRFDVNDGPHRGRIIKWLLSLGRQSIVLGALRRRDIPEIIPEGLQIKWLSAGTLVTE